MNAVNPGLIETQIARDVVNGNEEAYEDIARNVRRRRLLQPCCGFAVRAPAMWWVTPSPWMAECVV